MSRKTQPWPGINKLPHLHRLYVDPRETSCSERTEAPQCHARPSTSSRGLQGCGTGPAQPWATHHIITQMSGEPVCLTGMHSLLPPSTAGSTKGLWRAPGPGLTCNSHRSDLATWQASKNSTSVRKTPEKALQIGLIGKDREEQTGWDVETGTQRPNGAEATVVQGGPPTSPPRAIALWFLTAVTLCAKGPCPVRHTSHQKCSTALDQKRESRTC